MKRFIALLVLALVLFACDNAKGSDIPKIPAQDIFAVEAEEYYILFVKDDCSGCEKIKPGAARYHRETLLKKNLPKIYLVDVGDEANKIVVGKEDILDGASSVDELRITRTPTLIVIKKGKVSAHYINSANVGGFFSEIMEK
ncbi:MAG TPA: hypothetical protein GYA05_03100 [Acholeplasmataceae bacterium]|nr:hypothetical protein [Acholeplasmataceae bacterium]